MTLILNGTDNSATTPAVTGTDTDTGVYYPAANQVALATNGTLALLVNSAQNVGINSSNPGAKLTVEGTGNIVRLGDGTNSFNVRFQGPNNWSQELNTSTDVFTLQRNSVDFLGVNSAGGVSLKGASNTANGVGIVFPATQAASTNANTLDDYEEGTWTPTFTASITAPSSVTYNNQIGRYTKIGRVVYIEFYLGFTAYSGGSGTAQIGNLPFTAVGNPYSGFYFQENAGFSVTGTFYSMVVQVTAGATTGVILKLAPNTSSQGVDIAQITTSGTAYVIASGCYTTS